MLRFRASITFTETGQQLGLPTWCAQQAAQIEAMAWHLKEGQPGEELSYNEADGAQYRANFFMPEDELAVAEQLFNAIDSQATHIESGSMDIHVCHHDAELPQPCQSPTHSRQYGGSG